MWAGLDRSKLASIIYHVSKNKGECIGFTGDIFDKNGNPLKRNLDDDIPREDILRGYKHYFGETGVIEESELKDSELTISKFQIQYETESKIQETKVLSTSELDTSKPQISSKSDTKVSESQVMKCPEHECSLVQTLEKSEAKTSKSKA